MPRAVCFTVAPASATLGRAIEAFNEGLLLISNCTMPENPCRRTSASVAAFPRTLYEERLAQIGPLGENAEQESAQICGIVCMLIASPAPFGLIGYQGAATLGSSEDGLLLHNARRLGASLAQLLHLIAMIVALACFLHTN